MRLSVRHKEWKTVHNPGLISQIPVARTGDSLHIYLSQKRTR